MESVRKQPCLSPVPMKLTKVQRLLVDADLCLPATPEKPQSPVTAVEDTPAKEAQEQAQEVPAGAPLPASWQAMCNARECLDGSSGAACTAAAAPHAHSPSDGPSPLDHRNALGCHASELGVTPLKPKRSSEEALVCPGAPMKKSFRGAPRSFRISARQLFTDIPAQ